MQNTVNKFDITYMNIAGEMAKLSSANRAKVGAIVVKDRSIIAEGYNGTVSGYDNTCEGVDGKTLWHVVHAEANALCKLAKSTNSSDGATIYITLSPCKECAKLIHQCGIRRVVYKEEYGSPEGAEFLKERGIDVVNLSKAYPDYNPLL